jgi:hypothetical protein
MTHGRDNRRLLHRQRESDAPGHHLGRLVESRPLAVNGRLLDTTRRRRNPRPRLMGVLPAVKSPWLRALAGDWYCIRAPWPRARCDQDPTPCSLSRGSRDRRGCRPPPVHDRRRLIRLREAGHSGARRDVDQSCRRHRPGGRGRVGRWAWCSPILSKKRRSGRSSPSWSSAAPAARSCRRRCSRRLEMRADLK